MKKHFVTFYSPGTFVSEETTQEINSWNVEEAAQRAENITERYNARPFGFRFITKERGENDLDSTEIDRSNMYYVNCKIQTLPILILRNHPDDAILISNMQVNGWDKVATTIKGWRATYQINKGDVVL